MGNTVGSRESRIAFTARKKQVLWVQPQQLEILTGSILGDAYVSPLGKIQIEHSIHQREYILWKYEQLASISYPALPTIVQHANARTEMVYESLRFWTRQFFRPLRLQFYGKEGKFFPPDLELTPLMLAVWYMDDGHYERPKRRCILATDGYTLEDVINIQDVLSRIFSIQAVIRPSKKLAFDQLNSRKFIDLIDQYIFPAMQYKIC